MARKPRSKRASSSIEQLTPLDQQFIESAQRKRQVRVDGQSVELTQEAIAVQHLFKSAMGGSIHGMGQWIHYTQLAQEKEEAKRERQIEGARQFIELQRLKLKQAERRGEHTRLILPHPDDIEIDPATGVDFVGPYDETELLEVEKKVRLRDAYFVQGELETCFSWPEPPAEEHNPDCPFQDGSAEFLGLMTDRELPQRFRLSEDDRFKLAWRLSRMTKRELLKHAREMWRKAGYPKSRGWLTPPYWRTIKVYEAMPQFAERVAMELRTNREDAAVRELQIFYDQAREWLFPEENKPGNIEN
ncbi:MAG: hypothetical protein AAGK79_03460 [Pseudomonadota bacterium]